MHVICSNHDYIITYVDKALEQLLLGIGVLHTVHVELIHYLCHVAGIVVYGERHLLHRLAGAGYGSLLK